MSKILAWIVRLYPEEFRRAHEQELLEFIEQEVRLGARTALDLLWGAIRLRRNRGRRNSRREEARAWLSDIRQGVRSTRSTPLVTMVIRAVPAWALSLLLIDANQLPVARARAGLYNSFRYNEDYAMTKKRRSRSTTESPIRLTPAFFHILLAVVNEASHGYAIMQSVQERTGGTVKLGPGSLYWAIKRLVDAELLAEVGAPTREAGDERRRYYALTAYGRDVLKREVEILADIVGYAESQKLIRRAKVV